MFLSEKKLKVLFLSDINDIDGRKLLQNYHRFSVNEVGSKQAALEMVRTNSFDLIVFNHFLLGDSKKESLETIKKLKILCPEAPIIMMSYFSDDIFVAEAVHAGVSAYIIRQKLDQEFSDAVMKVVNGHRYISPWVPSAISSVLQNQKSNVQKAAKDTIEIEPLTESLTERQKEILRLLAEGYTNKQVAKKLSLSVKTVDAHRANIMNKLKVNGLPGLIKYAIRIGLVAVGG
ncbi:MAG: response regulator transcription factor [Blastocatellia bacterium]|nr:response regulator transcription factor [Blastocatellia bacterium]